MAVNWAAASRRLTARVVRLYDFMGLISRLIRGTQCCASVPEQQTRALIRT